MESRQTYGAKRLTIALKSHFLPFKVGVNRVRKIMKQLGLRCESVKKYRPKTKSKVYELGANLLNRQFKTSILNHAWVTDITYIYVPKEGFCYLTTVIDLASRKPIGWHFSKSMNTDAAINALKKALVNQNFPKNVIIHSDRGSQFTSYAFRNFTKLMNLRQSFSNKGCPYDNAVIESFHSLLKKEFVYRYSFSSFEHAKMCIFDYIENFYIRHRLHSSIGYITPQDMENKLRISSQAAA
jgi:transposase InsO family protein